ncbi:WYL domain-containing protein [Plastoroseomonas hellenica]|uniref:WYL domain-containing protein n=1 Tax=Plastoroseomonas hellenica TaxID=2687306 RepID=UPI001BAC00BB|nr:WYL domain-containing protein [Plastoroseomonas hellenica]MBR0642929.1 WYL domain-containing protein [Plastoroseomonas hellenica]
MALISWLKSLFFRTGDTPPLVSPSLQPTGLDRDDDASMVQPPHVQSQSVAMVATELGPAASLLKRSSGPEQTKESGARAGSSSPGELIDDDVYGLTFIVDYQDARGACSRRRIMLRSIAARDGDFYLRALCFERNALRTFRLDRVLRIIDTDGEIHEDPAAFFRDELRLKMDVPPPVAQPPVEARMMPSDIRAPTISEPKLEKPGVAQRRVARDGLRVLVALARSDSTLHEAEVEVVLDYVAAVCTTVGVPFETEDRSALGPYIRRQRPGMDVLVECLTRLDSERAETQALLLDYAERVIHADGELHDSEDALLRKIRGPLGAA